MKKFWIGLYVFYLTHLVNVSAAFAGGDLENLLEGSEDYLSSKIIPLGGALGVTLGGGLAAIGGRNGGEIAKNAVVGTGIGTVGASLIYLMVRLSQ